MNKNKLKKKHTKHAVVKSKFKGKKNDSTEVFVLPPNLLQKLGINLANFGTPQESQIDAEHQPDIDKRCHTMTGTVPKEDTSSARYSTQVQYSQVIENEGTSFSQTASLMKESVFLSPTFIPTQGSLIDGEFEIANVPKTYDTNLGIHDLNKESEPNIVIAHISDNNENLITSNSTLNLFSGSSGKSSSSCNIQLGNSEICTVSENNEHKYQTKTIPNESYNSLTLKPTSYQDTFINERSVNISYNMPFGIPAITNFDNAEPHNQNKNNKDLVTKKLDNNKDLLIEKSSPNNFKHIQLGNKLLNNVTKICNSNNDLSRSVEMSCDSLGPDEAYSSDSIDSTKAQTVKSDVVNGYSAIKSYDYKKSSEEAHSKSKISITCDHIIKDKSHLPKLAIWKSPEKGTFIPVTMNTLVSRGPGNTKSECMELNLDNINSTNNDVYQIDYDLRFSHEKPSVINYGDKYENMDYSNALVNTNMNKKHEFINEKSPIVTENDGCDESEPLLIAANNNDLQNCIENESELNINDNNPNSCFENNLLFFADIVERHINTNKSYVDKYFNAKLSQQKDIFSGHDVLSGVKGETEIISNIFLAHNNQEKGDIFSEDLEYANEFPLTKSVMNILDIDSTAEVEKTFNPRDTVSSRLKNNTLNNSDNNLHLFVEIIEKHVENYLENEAILQDFSKEVTISNDDRGKHNLSLRLNSDCLQFDENLIRDPNDDHHIFEEVNSTHGSISSPLSDFSTEDSICSHRSQEETNKMISLDSMHECDKSSVNLFSTNFYDSSLSDYTCVPIVIEIGNEQRLNDSNNHEICNASKQTTVKYLDQVNEIAMCLANYKRLHSDKADRETNENSTCVVHNKLDEIDFPTNSKYKLDSKLCIQGVEKPGGSEKNQASPKITSVKKTYQRRTRKKTDNQKPVMLEVDKLKKITKSVPIDDSDLFDLEISDQNKYFLKEIFCICSDFGLMSYYDCENVFEHIHFGGKRATDCEVNVLLSIYNEDSNDIDRSNYDEVFECNEKVNDYSTITEQSICWKTLDDPHNLEIDYPDSLFDICNHLQSEARTSIRTKSKAEDLRGTLKDANEKEVLSLEIKDYVNSELSAEKLQSPGLEVRLSAIEKIDHNLNTQVTNDLRNSDDDKINSTANGADDTIMVLHVLEGNSTIDDANLGTEIEINSNANKNITRELEKFNTKEAMVVQTFDKTQNYSIENCGKSATPAKQVSVTGDKDADCGPSHVLDTKNEMVQKRPESRAEEELLIKPNDPVNEKIRNLRNAIQRILNGDSKNTSSKETMSDKITKRKKSLSQSDDAYISGDNDEPSTKKSVKCGVCSELMEADKWEHHLAQQHCYVAWKAGENLSIYDDDLLLKLSRKVQDGEALKCTFCNVEIRNVEIFLVHLKKCLKEKGLILNIHIDICAINPVIKDEPIELSDDENDKVKCGVCSENVESPNWFDHMAKEHNYLAWKVGESSIDLEDQRSVRKHLQSILKEYGKLACGKCSLNYKNVKSYLCHIKICGENVENNEDQMNDSLNDGDSSVASVALSGHRDLVKCGVCFNQVSTQQWIDHMQVHNYLAWQIDDTPLNLNNKEEIRKHLFNVLRQYGGLTCFKCGLVRKYVKPFQQHVKTCTERSLDEPISNIKDESLFKEKSGKNPKKIKRTSSRQMEETNPETVVKCVLCKEKVTENQWISHIQSAHGYLAWKEGHEPLNVYDEDAIKAHLDDICRNVGHLTCNKCDGTWKRVGWYMLHAKSCNGQRVTENDSKVDESVDDSLHGKSCDLGIQDTSTDLEESLPAEVNTDVRDTVICGVCQDELKTERWLSHIHQHDYLAWKEGETPIILDDETALWAHLRQISKKCGGLICSKCGMSWKRVKRYLNHLRICGQNVSIFEDKINDIVETELDSTLNNTSDSSMTQIGTDSETVVTCGVCKQKEITDTERVNEHLTTIAKKRGSLICKKCGVTRKYVKSYLNHVKTCDIVEHQAVPKTFFKTTYQPSSKGVVMCAVCSEEMNSKDWKRHAMQKHYNIAWKVGDDPIDLKKPYGVEKYLKEYKSINKSLTCNVCKATRVSCNGFYAHIITCGKTDEETECYKNWCQICESKYLCIYKNQHMAMHREQEYAKARKMKAVEEKAKQKNEVGFTPGPRQAAEKAKNVIGEYNSANDVKTVKKKYRKSAAVQSDSDESVQFEAYSGVESSDTEVESDLSADEEQKLPSTKKKKRKKESAPVKVDRLPFRVNHPNSYLRDGAEKFHKLHYTQEKLFPQWHSSEYHAVEDEHINQYVPSLEESCNVKLMSDGWKTYKRFEAEVKHGYSLFAGGSIQCISWIPGRVDDSEDVCRNYLSVVCHAGPDSPRLRVDELSAYAGLIQIWDFGNFNMTPKLELGLAHDYGTIWAMDWCPSGARDSILDFSESGKTCRMGLLAVACSNGSAYIFSVPYPNRIKKDDKIFYKLKPVVELRLSMSGERNKFQASALRWSIYKGHSLIVVGYGDGTTAYYNLNCDSALLKSEENGVILFYPYHDERTHASCVSGVDLFPGASQWDTLVSTASPVGCQLSSKTARIHSNVTAATANFLPYWPTLLAAGDDHFMALVVNEIDWCGVGRRFGSVRRACGCPCCGVVAAYMTPVLRLLQAHPAHADLKKRSVGSLQMVPLEKKKRKQKNDELSMVLEPFTYEDAIKEYGIELKLPTSKESMEKMDLLSRSGTQLAERFPLDDIPCMAFCPTFRNHNKLAVATHAGLIFVVNV